MGERKKADCHTGEWVTGVAMAGGITGVVRRWALRGFLTRGFYSMVPPPRVTSS